METECIRYTDLDFLPQLIQDYILSPEKIESLYTTLPNLESIGLSADNKQFSREKRTVLANVLEEQYTDLENSTLQLEAIKQLRKDHTYTITTGHQLCLFTGPMYFIYKIISAVKTAQMLKSKFEDKTFVPIYWMATEDHDFLEINHFNVNGHKVVWEGENTIAVGRLKVDLKHLADQLTEILGPGKNAKGLLDLFRSAYTEKDTLANATRYIVHSLLGKLGIVVVDADDTRLKQLFTPIMELELKNSIAEESVEKSNETLIHMGYSTQVNPRAINLFYLGENYRGRIEKSDAGYRVVDQGKSWTEKELFEELKACPEHFSPNVLLRPVYQEVILPNLAYIGGAGELSYWFQLKELFQQLEVDFPALMLRNSAVIQNRRDADRKRKLKLNWSSLFGPKQELESDLVKIHGEKRVDFDKEFARIEGMFDEIGVKLKSLETTLDYSSGVAKSASLKALKRLQRKTKQAELRNMDKHIEMTDRLKTTIFPGGVFQERYVNFSQIYLQTGDAILETLLTSFDPFDPDIKVITLGE